MRVLGNGDPLLFLWDSTSRAPSLENERARQRNALTKFWWTLSPAPRRKRDSPFVGVHRNPQGRKESSI